MNTEEYIHNAFGQAKRATMVQFYSDSNLREYYRWNIYKCVEENSHHSVRVVVDHKAQVVTLYIQSHPNPSRLAVKIYGNLSGEDGLEVRLQNNDCEYQTAGIMFIDRAFGEDGAQVIDLVNMSDDHRGRMVGLKCLPGDKINARTLLPKDFSASRFILFTDNFDQLDAMQKVRILFTSFYNHYLVDRDHFQCKVGVANAPPIIHHTGLGFLLGAFLTEDVYITLIQDTSFKCSLDSTIYREYQMELKRNTVVGYIEYTEDAFDNVSVQVVDSERNPIFQVNGEYSLERCEIVCEGETLGRRCDKNKSPHSFYDKLDQNLVSHRVRRSKGSDGAYVNFYQNLAFVKIAYAMTLPDHPDTLRFEMRQQEMEINEFSMILTSLIGILGLGDLQREESVRSL